MDSGSPKASAGEVLDTVPLVMQFIRTEMRRSRGSGISVPQFRVLTFLNRAEAASLSAVADRVGLSLPAMSRLVEGLVQRRLVHREESPADRRRVTLHLTADGRELIRTARAAAQARLADALATLSSPQRIRVGEAMELLRPVFFPKPKDRDVPEG